MASQYLARLGIVLGVDSGELVQGIEDAKKQFHNFKNQVEKDTKAAAREFEVLKNATEDYGKTLTKVEQIQREIDRGRFMFASQNVKDKLLEQAKAYDAQAASMKKVSGTMSEFQKMQVTYQLTDFATQIASGQNAMIAFIQQGGQLKDSMGGVGNAFRAITSLITPAVVGFGAVTAVIGTLAYALYEADKEFSKFQDSLTLTGNFAGLTAHQLVAMSASLSQMTNTTVSQATGALDAVVSSGKFTSVSIESVTKAILTYSKVAGVDSKTAAEKLMSGLDGSAKSAKTLNDSMNFLTLAQYKQIEALELAGKKQEAAKLAADILNGKIEAQKRILGDLEQAWENTKNAMSKYWSSLKNAIFGPGDNEGMLKKTNEDIKAIEFSMSKGMTGSERQKYEERLAYLQKRREEIEAAIKASKESEVPSGEKPGISDFESSGGIARSMAMAAQLAKTRKETEIEKAKETADEINRIRLDAEKKVYDKQKDFEAIAGADKRARYGALQDQLNADIEQINAERDRKISDARYKQYLKELDFQIAAMRHQEELDKAQTQKKIDAELEAYRTTQSAKDEAKYQNDLLAMQMSMLGATEKEKAIAEEKLRIEKEIAQWKRSEQYGLLSKDDQKFYEDQKRAASDARIVNIQLAESVKYLQGMYDAVWSNMTSAIETFVRTGKLSIKDFTKSVIQDMLIMNMKLQAMTLLRGLFTSLFAPTPTGDAGGYALNFSGVKLGGAKAMGGPVNGGTPYLVGERGPELFMPSGSGTIIPNNKLAGGSTTNVTNNYINAIDAKSFEQRLLESNQAIWSANQYASKNLATNFGRT